MSDSDDASNLGCLGCLGILLALVGGCIYLGYEFYNCSVNRPIPRADFGKISVKGTIADDLFYFSVSNGGDWTIHSISIRVNIQKMNGERLEYTANLKTIGLDPLDIAPSSRNGYLVLQLNDADERLIKSARKERWDFQLVEVTGRRKPIRIVKNIKESFSEGMTKIKQQFEREK